MAFTTTDGMPPNQYAEAGVGGPVGRLREARGLTPMQQAEAAVSTQRAVVDYETEAGFSVALAGNSLAIAPNLNSAALVGFQPSKTAPVEDGLLYRVMLI